MISMKTEYRGDLRTVSQHLKSGKELITDAPTDNHGKGEAFSPTDLLATALASCILTIMGIEAKKMRKDIKGAKASITKIMDNNPRRIGEVKIEIACPGKDLSEEEKELLEERGKNCPVALSVSDDLKQTVSFDYF